MALRNTTVKVCKTAAEAQVEIERLMAGIAGFDPGCKVVGMERVEDMWIARIDDPEDEYEYHSFSITDDGEADWD